MTKEPMTEPRAEIAASMRDAATVVLLRQTAAGLETFLLHRQAAMTFAGGEWVFPGGVVEVADQSARALLQIVPPAAATLAALRRHYTGATLETDAALAIGVAACRETFEESGVLLARHKNDLPCEPTLLKSLQSQRTTFGTDPEAFTALLEAHDLFLELDRLAYWANWITPSMAPRRFDTRFFVIPMPEGQEVSADVCESQDAAWVALQDPDAPPQTTPPITAPPTVFSLRELAAAYRRAGSLAALMTHAQAQTPPVVMLRMRRSAEDLQGLMPWDEDYATAPGDSVPCDEALRRRFAMFPSRLQLDPVTKLPR